MNAQDEGGSDSQNFDRRIAEIGVAVANMRRKEVVGTIL
jgi:hypothetical protein